MPEVQSATETTIGGMTPAGRNLALTDKLEMETSGALGRYLTGAQILGPLNLGVSDIISIGPGVTARLENPCPKVIRATYGNDLSKLVAPPATGEDAFYKNSPGFIVLINQGAVDGNFYNYGTNGNNGSLICSVPAYTGVIAWNEDNSIAAGNWTSIEYITLPQLGRYATTGTSDDTITTLFSVPVGEDQGITLTGEYSLDSLDYDPAKSNGGDFIAKAVRQEGGDVTLVGVSIINALAGIPATPPQLTIDVDTGTQTMRVRVQGEAATNYIWNAKYLTEIF